MITLFDFSRKHLKHHRYESSVNAIKNAIKFQTNAINQIDNDLRLSHNFKVDKSRF